MTTMPSAEAGFQARAGWLVRQLMTDLNVSMEQAAGFVGNLGYESGEFKKLQEIRPEVAGSAGGYGWAQWTGSRRRDFMAYCSSHHLAPSSDEANYGFLVHELQQEEWEGFLRQLRGARGLEQAARITEQFYERPREAQNGTYASLPTRIAKARVALAGAQAKDSGPTPVPVPSTPPVVDHQADIISAIRSIQISLAWLGYYKGRVDGDWGDQTEDAMCAMLDAREGLERC